MLFCAFHCISFTFRNILHSPETRGEEKTTAVGRNSTSIPSTENSFSFWASLSQSYTFLADFESHNLP